MTTARGAPIVLGGLTKRFAGVAAVDGIDLAVEPGEFLTLLGASGSGKTTTLMMIAGFVEPTAGSVRIAGTDVTPLPPGKRDLGVVFQSYALFPHMTVARNLAFPLALRRMSRREIEARVTRALETVELADRRHALPRELSGGQQQRVALARALIFEPRALLMDEPLGALDKRLRQSMQTEIKRIHERLGATIVYVTHDQEEALAMSDRIAVMIGGRIAQHGTPDELYYRPNAQPVAQFLGESNLLTGRVDRNAHGDLCLRLDGGEQISLAADVAARHGERRTVMIRPEKCRIAGDDAGGAAPGLPVRIDGLRFIGHAVMVGASRPDGLPMLAQIEAGPASRGLRPGMIVRATWDPRDAWMLPAARS
ncbi:MAG: ABC transporter ATP-binding protein [Alphaproteobacteria bacterium]|nr:ABC transporter ATP-binding protein [Alphaproteobacteria bacterium]